MAGRPRQFDEDASAEIAMQLFWTQGYEATSLNDLLKAMGLSKSSFYQTFESKHALFEQSLVRYGAMLIGDMHEGLAGAPNAMAFIHAALSDIAKETNDPRGRRGCLMMNTAAEFAQTDPSIARCVKAGIDATGEVFVEAVVAAQFDGDIGKNLKPQLLADYLVTTVIGLKTQVKAGASRKRIMSIADVSVAALKNM